MPDHLHSQPDRSLRHDASHVAETDDSQSLVADFHSHELVPLPLPGFEGGDRLGNMAGERQHQRDGVLGGSHVVAARRVHDHDAFFARGLDIDILDADASPANDFEIFRGPDEIRGHLSAAANHPAVIFSDNLFEICRLEPQTHVDLEVRGAFKNLKPLRG